MAPLTPRQTARLSSAMEPKAAPTHRAGCFDFADWASFALSLNAANTKTGQSAYLVTAFEQMRGKARDEKRS